MLKKCMKIKIPKNYFRKLKYKISLPMMKCGVCGKKILLTPTNILIYSKKFNPHI